MFGAIVGDIIGSTYEWHNVKSLDFPLFPPDGTFTDDTVLTIATAEAIMRGHSYAECYRKYYFQYPDRGYGNRFSQWCRSRDLKPYGSCGNGSAMRVSPVAYVFKTLEQVLSAAKDSASATHDHPEGIKGAQSLAAAVFMALHGSTKKEIKNYITETFAYDLEKTLDEIRPGYVFDVLCQGSVPQAVRAFLESCDFEHSIRLAVSLGGDSDTIACMTGAVAEAFYRGVPPHISAKALSLLDPKLVKTLEEFRNRFGIPW